MAANGKHGEKPINTEKAANAANKEWAVFKETISSQLLEIVSVGGTILFLPVFILVGVGYGLREGIITGVEKFLGMMKEWGR